MLNFLYEQFNAFKEKFSQWWFWSIKYTFDEYYYHYIGPKVDYKNLPPAPKNILDKQWQHYLSFTPGDAPGVYWQIFHRDMWKDYHAINEGGYYGKKIAQKVTQLYYETFPDRIWEDPNPQHWSENDKMIFNIFKDMRRREQAEKTEILTYKLQHHKPRYDF